MEEDEEPSQAPLRETLPETAQVRMCPTSTHMSWLAHISHFPLNRGRSRCASRANRAPLRRRRGAGREWRLRLRRSTTLPWWLYFETFCNERQVGADTAACWFRTVVNGYRIVCARPFEATKCAHAHSWPQWCLLPHLPHLRRQARGHQHAGAPSFCTQLVLSSVIPVPACARLNSSCWA